MVLVFILDDSIFLQLPFRWHLIDASEPSRDATPTSDSLELLTSELAARGEKVPWSQGPVWGSREVGGGSGGSPPPTRRG